MVHAREPVMTRHPPALRPVWQTLALGVGKGLWWSGRVVVAILWIGWLGLRVMLWLVLVPLLLKSRRRL